MFSRYDTAVTGSVDFRRTYTYDNSSRPVSTVTSIGSTSYGTSLSYDAASRVEVITYPANNFAVRNVYNPQGYLQQVQKANDANLIYWRAEYVNADGQVAREARDADPTPGIGIEVNRGYDAASGRIQSITAGAGNSIQNLQYTFDSLGNLEQRVDEVDPDPANVLVETFGYDDLNRLTRVDTDISGVTLSKTVGYDNLGNIINKSDVGAYSYDPARPHAVAAAGTNTYSYDANGNMFTGAGRTLTWSSANLPTQISKGSATLSFSYGPDRSRYKQVASVGGITETTHYVGGLYEKIVKSGVTTHRHYIQAGQEAIAVQINRSSGDLSDLRYLFRDHLGSVEAITDRAGAVKERFSYDAWGLRRMVRPTDAMASLVLPYGFTNHEQLDGVGLIHMNGRVYDPVISRFVSADPFVQFPKDSQSLNRYSYVLNNPLSFTDPSGFFLDDLIGDIVGGVVDFAGDVVQYVADNPRVIVAIGIGVFTGFTAAGVLGDIGFSAGVAGAIGGFYGGLFATGDLDAALVGAGTGAAFGFIGGYEPFFGDIGAITPQRVIAHGLVGGTSAEVQGGNFGSGFFSAAIAKAATGPIDAQFNGNITAGTAATAVVGGTISRITGGKFANGAVTAAFGYLFNAKLSERQLESLRLRTIAAARDMKELLNSLSDEKFAQVFALAGPQSAEGLTIGDQRTLQELSLNEIIVGNFSKVLTQSYANALDKALITTGKFALESALPARASAVVKILDVVSNLRSDTPQPQPRVGVACDRISCEALVY